ncbi:MULTISPECIES: cation:proton antiporter [Thalassospira]|jgi:NhaP-type Na+/H+ or K+/H+ antiporter|uniref:cation:proton antiporter n=1 Tax=Thalassospira TaxID=168934 RepID=UPI000DED62BC|nr:MULTISPECIES: cation:proton antiporter [Thalassospira]MEE3047565.1 cation:proton antiporter [Pseudomonadota bacterium]RCK27828.1 peptidase [Thalassospira profundimaris]MBO6770113.1 cation:proton antiporter [Thalassospira sp.]MCC4239639.1 cation:proton antiporter [Thalassospira povalilytica]URK16979.1 cation:proton antiporter [Thalassospira sp. GO-4]|eukprot:TRINITY_DN990_c0_g9_i2.p1 TRINITY_DN990_c0_g9~~TRINITY_DN990_c0_g9_i2.p1  ORF type:complete len:409 (-),score=74.57 TRINITY_DN990_c0_g9_i2:2753-3979(-)
MFEWVIILFLGSGLVYGLFSRRLQRRNISSPMMMVLSGALIALPLGIWHEAPLRALSGGLHFATRFAEMTLAIILFLDAAVLNYRKEQAAKNIALRLLLIGLPLTILATWGFIVGLDDSVRLIPALILALIVSPTDAALGRPVLENRDVPDPVRQGINIESGLNDGLVLPVFTTAVLLEANLLSNGHQGWIKEALLEISAGAGIGIGCGFVLGKIVNHVVTRDMIVDRFERLLGVLAAILIYLLAEQLGGNGFVAAFAGGLSLNISSDRVRDTIESFGEAEAELLTMLTFFVFGMIVVPAVYESWTWEMLAFSVASLVILRPLCVWICMIGSPYSPGEKLYIGWFGPRGIASVIYMLIMATLIDPGEFMPLFAAGTMIICISIVAHGISAAPASRALVRYLAKRSAKD